MWILIKVAQYNLRQLQALSKLVLGEASLAVLLSTSSTLLAKTNSIVCPDLAIRPPSLCRMSMDHRVLGRAEGWGQSTAIRRINTLIIRPLRLLTCSGLSTANGMRASIGTTQGEIVVAKFLAKNGPRGTYSHFCEIDH